MTHKSPRRRRVGRSALLLVTAMLVGSGLIRLGDGSGLAIAREVSNLAHDPKPAVSPAACPSAPDTMALFNALQIRETKVAESEKRLSERRRTLELAGEQITRQMAALKQAESSLKATIAVTDQASEKDIARLTAVYENMKPKDAAALFETMAPDFAAGFLGRMRPDAAAQIMAGLAPQTAYSISVIVAGRNARAPTN